MNKLHLPGRIWLASDMHLGPQTLETNRAFLNFLALAADQADTLILGGDIFNVWVGDDIIHSPPDWLAEILHALQALADTTPLYLCRGNRDFLMGNVLCARIKARLLPDQTILVTDAGAVLFSHGDEYCTDDHAYQRFRHWVRKPWVQRIFLAFGLPQRQRWAGYARQRSMQANRKKQHDIMDVNPQAIQEAFDAAEVAIMVHGHTHRTAIHETGGPNGPLTRLVLPDWDYDTYPRRGGWLEISQAGLRFRDMQTQHP